MSGQAANLSANIAAVNYLLLANSGTFNFTGAPSFVGYSLSLGSGSFALTGESSGFTPNLPQYTLTAQYGSFAFTGIAATFTKGGPTTIPMPNVYDLTLGQAIALLQSYGYTTITTGNVNGVLVPPGSVASQNPVAGTPTTAGTLITLLVSIGPFVPAPNPNLGYKVSSRQFSLEEMVAREWGPSFRAPDHRIYEFTGGRSFDSTDIGTTGIYQHGTSTL
jgi:hypothetical protein